METRAPLAQGEYDFSDDIAYDDRYHICLPLAQAGDALAAQTVGLLLYSGVGGCAGPDARESARWHAKSASLGNLDALATLGGCVRRGVGAERDEATGVQLIREAAAAGSPVGLVKLGVLHDEGEGVAQDSWEAARLFEAAAVQGSALGHFHFGWALVHGIGVARDTERGLAQWREAMARAPDDGAEEAAYYLYEERKLITDPALHEAIRPAACLRLAAALGFDLALRRLERATERRAMKRKLEEFSKPRGRTRFVRNDKARQWTARDERGEAFLES